MEGVEWGPGLIALAVGAVLGLFLVWRLKSSPSLPAPSPETELDGRDLEARCDALLQQLRGLEDAPRGDAAAAARERYALELQAAQVLRELERRPSAVPAEPTPPAPSAAASARPASSLSGFLWGMGSATALGLLLFAVSRDATQRQEGDQLTGDIPSADAAPPGAGSGSATPDPELAQLLAAVERAPEDLSARLALAQGHLMRQDLMGVYQQTQYVLERRPDDPRALSYQSLVRLAMGQPQQALDMLQQALELEPDYLEAYVHLALVQTQTGDAEAASATVAEAARRHPDQAAMLERLLGEMRRASAGSPPLPEGSHPDVRAPAGEAPARGPAVAAAGRPGFSGTLRLAPGLGPLPARAVIFLYVRESGYTSGAPNAVKRFSPQQLPLAFEITAADSMLGGELPERARIEARVDGDGDVSTRDPNDPVAALEDVPLGSQGIELVLAVGR